MQFQLAKKKESHQVDVDIQIGNGSHQKYLFLKILILWLLIFSLGLVFYWFHCWPSPHDGPSPPKPPIPPLTETCGGILTTKNENDLGQMTFPSKMDGVILQADGVTCVWVIQNLVQVHVPWTQFRLDSLGQNLTVRIFDGHNPTFGNFGKGPITLTSDNLDSPFGIRDDVLIVVLTITQLQTTEGSTIIAFSWTSKDADMDPRQDENHSIFPLQNCLTFTSSCYPDVMEGFILLQGLKPEEQFMWILNTNLMGPFVHNEEEEDVPIDMAMGIDVTIQFGPNVPCVPADNCDSDSCAALSFHQIMGDGHARDIVRMYATSPYVFSATNLGANFDGQVLMVNLMNMGTFEFVIIRWQPSRQPMASKVINESVMYSWDHNP